MDFDRLRAVAKSKGVSFAYLSTQIGKSRYWLFGCERDGSRISIVDQQRIASMLSTTVEYLNGETDDPEVDDTEIMEIVEQLRNDDGKRMLFHLLDGCTKQDILRTVAIIEALKKSENGNG